MFSLQLNDRIITVVIEYKRNKNTYFRFHKDNIVKVTAPKRQSTKRIKDYILENQQIFIKKLDAVKIFKHDFNSYQYFNDTYQIKRNLKHVGYQFDEVNKILFIPLLETDHEYRFLKFISKKLMINELTTIREKYINNSIVNIENINFKTRYMTSRYGSCNKAKRNININLYLLHYDKKYLEYVFLHEITHLDVPNHSQLFYNTFQKLSPQYKDLRKELKRIYTHR